MAALSRPLLRRIAFLRRNRCGALVVALCLFILFNPVLADSSSGRIVLSIALIGIMVLAVWAIRGRRLMAAVVSLALVAMASLGTEIVAGHTVRPLSFAATAAMIGAVTVALLYYVLDWRKITPDKVFAAVSAYVLIAITFASLFSLLQVVQPRAFHVAALHEPDGHLGWHDMMYFSFTVLTSTGFGEITPVTNTARSLIVIEQVLGVMYVAFLVARLANLYGKAPQERA